MGRKTFESLPSLLPNRKHIIITSSNYQAEGALVVHTIKEVLDYVNNHSDEECFIIGECLFINNCFFMLNIYI